MPVDEGAKATGQEQLPWWFKRLLSSPAEDTEYAYQLQMRGAREGAIRGILYTGFACGVAQVLWPLFKRQTIAFKAFLISAGAMTGMTLQADTYLLRHEKWQRRADDMMRRTAREELGRKGIIATENELQKWKDARLAQYRRASLLPPPPSPESS